MSEDIRQIFESHRCYVEVSPHWIDLEESSAEGPVFIRRVQTGFDLDIYGIKTSRDPDPPAEYWLVYNKLKEIADVVRHEYNQACSVELIPFGSAIILERKNGRQPMAMLRIRVTHNGGIHEPAGVAEQQALKAVRAQLSALGVTAARSREHS